MTKKMRYVVPTVLLVIGVLLVVTSLVMSDMANAGLNLVIDAYDRGQPEIEKLPFPQNETLDIRLSSLVIDTYILTLLTNTIAQVFLFVGIVGIIAGMWNIRRVRSKVPTLAERVANLEAVVYDKEND
jgi:hypothetical protein